jgi:hypothetical protein
MVGALVTSPLDVVKTRLQVSFHGSLMSPHYYCIKAKVSVAKGSKRVGNNYANRMAKGKEKPTQQIKGLQ